MVQQKLDTLTYQSGVAQPRLFCGGYITPDYLQVQYLYEYSSLSRSGYRYWATIKDRLRRSYKAQPT